MTTVPPAVMAAVLACTDRTIPTPRRPKEPPMTAQTRWRKKPVVIQAMQFDGTKESANQILGWIGSNGADAKRAHSTKPDLGVIINTLEGDMTVSPGDFVIRGVQGEFYPYKPDIFEATYEPADSPA